MAYYNICPICGATLDPNEVCLCKQESEERAARWEKMTKEESGGQLCLLPETEKEKTRNENGRFYQNEQNDN